MSSAGLFLSQATLAMVRHDLRTPLNHIIGYSEMLLEEAAERGEQDLIPGLEEILLAARHLVGLIQDALSPACSTVSESDIRALRRSLDAPVNRIIGSASALVQHNPGRSRADLVKIEQAATTLLTLGEAWLVASVGPALPEDATSQRAATPLAGHVLVVDDNELNRDVLSRQLKRHGLTAQEAAEGPEALCLLAQGGFDLVLLDVMMPGMDGFEVLQQIKSDPTLRHIPVLMVSALDEVKSVIRCIDSGADDYLFKPFDPVLLRARINSSLERKRLREQDVNRAADLEQSCRRLLQAERQLRQSNEELEIFASAASHDLQEPLRTVTCYLQLLARRNQGKLDQDSEVFLNYCVQGAKRMSHLIQNLLAYAHASNAEYEQVPVDFSAILADTLDSMRTVIQDTGATIAADGLPTVPAEPVQAARLLQNLLSNSLKYCRPQEPPSVRVTARQNGKEWIFAIADNGIGIDARHCERLFQPFQRLHGREISGTGMGLAICKKIVERLGGRIWVESRLGEGSTFLFTLPQEPNL